MSLLSAILLTAEAVEMKDHRALCIELCPQLKELTDRAKILVCAMRERLIDSYVNHSASSHHHLEYLRRASLVTDDCNRLITEAKSLKSKESPGVHMEELKNFTNDLINTHGSLIKLCEVFKAIESISKAGIEFQRADCASAVARLDAVVESLSTLNLDSDAGLAVFNIRSAANGRRALYLTQLSREWEEMFSWSDQSGATHVTYSLLVNQSDVTRLHNLLQSLYQVNRLHDEMADFAHFFITKIVKRIINNSCEIFTDENVDKIIFNIKFDREDDRRPNFQSIFANLTAVLEFLQSSMGVTFPDGCTLISVLSQSLADRFFNVLIEDCIKTYVPDCDGSYQQYKRLVAELDSFNKFLTDIKFTTKNCSPLDKYLKNINSILYKKKCDKLLNQTRRLLSESLSQSTFVISGECEVDASILNTTETVRDSVNRPLMLPRCVVSEAIRSVLLLINSNLIEAVKMNEQYSHQLIRYIADIVVMYQTLVPSIYEVNLRDNPLDIALFFNNSFYLAHGLLGSPWALTLPPDLADHLNTILAPSFTDLRTLGLHYLSKYLRNQKNKILDTISSEQKPWNYDTYEEFDISITESLKIMQTLKNKWFDILPTAMYDKSMSTLVEAFCQAILARIFNTGHKYVEEDFILMMAMRIEGLVKYITSFYKDTLELSSVIKIWKKFSLMPVILKAQMFEMATLWTEGDGCIPQTYTCEEIRNVVKIRFPEDENRLKVLAAIQ